MSQELNFTRPEELGRWLTDKPAAWAQVIAWRAALRVVPALGQLANSKLSDQHKQRLISCVYRALLISSAARAWPADDMKAAAFAAARDADAFAARAADAADAAFAAARAFAAAAFAARAAAAAFAAARAAFAAVWSTVTGDAAFLDQGGAPEELADQPLWPGQPPAKLRELWEQHKQAAPDFAPWQAWYEAATGWNGQAPHNRFGGELTRRIALQTKAWWARDPAAVNADVARWLRVTPDNIRPRHISDGVDGEDLLGVRRQARLFARLLADRETDLPLAIGLFGPWGGGKSFFMKEIKEGIEELAESRAGHCHHAVAHIAFNAWHYVDADLWASLGLRIFEGITEHLGGQKENKLVEERQKLGAAIASSQRLKEEADAGLQKARANRDAAAAELARKQAERQKTRDGATLTALKAQFGAKLGQDMMKIAEAVGVATPQQSADIKATIDEAIRARDKLGKYLPRFIKTTALQSDLFLPIGMVAAALLFTGFTPDARALFGEAITYISTSLAALVSIVAGWTARIKPMLEKAQAAAKLAEEYKQIINQQEQDAPSPDSNAATLAQIDGDIAALNGQIAAADAEISAKQARLLAIDSGMVIYDHLSERAKDPRYIDRQGVVAVLRQDLESLATYLKAQASGHAKTERIILYIDDLDRCEPKRVVEVLQAVHLLLAFPLFAVVVAVDPRWLERALYEKYAPDERPKRGETRTGDFCPRNYLEKIFQIPYRLKPMNDGFTALVDGLTKNMIEAPARDVSPKVDSRLRGNDDKIKSEMNNDEEKLQEANDELKTGKADAGGATEDKDQTPPPPLPRLTLSLDEVAAIKKLQPFIPTPRGAKRLLNVYLLARMQQPAAAETPGVAMTLLALEIGFPVAGRDLLKKIRAAGRDSTATLLSLVAPADPLAKALKSAARDITVAAAFPWLDAAAQFSFDAPEDDAPEDAPEDDAA